MLLEKDFIENFNAEVIVSSPGRINIIGEHTDYNDGYVLPAAIDKTITLRLGKNGSDTICRIKSLGYGDILKIDLQKISRSNEGWENYVLGVLHEIMLRSNGLKGFDCTIESNLPVGSGVSSSAALECGLAYGLNELFKLGLDNWEIIKLSQYAEHSYVGTKCGIMDQFASVMGKDNHVMLLDCQSKEFEYIPMNIEPYRFLLLNSKVTHNLATSEYNVRRQQCKEGIEVIQRYLEEEVSSLRNVSEAMLQSCKSEMGDTIYNRCSFVLEENSRVLEARNAIRNNDLKGLGRLMYKTHEGLSTKYEVSCPELDFLVDFSKEWPDVLGARMMGGGFGGCTLNIIHNNAVEDFVKQVLKVYKDKFGITLSFFQTTPSEGTHLKLG